MKTCIILFLILILSIPGWGKENDSNHPLTGDWLFETDMGRTILRFEVASDSSFNAYTRKKASKEVLGFWPSTFARTLTSNFKEGSLIRIEQGTVLNETDTFKFEGLLVSVFGNFRIQGFLCDTSLSITLLNKSGKPWQEIKANKGVFSTPLADYPELARQVQDTTEKYIYNQSVLESAKYQKFTKRMAKIAEIAEDDLEFVIGFFYHGGKLPFSHYGLARTGKENVQEDSSKNIPRYATLEEIDSGIAYLRIRSFKGSVAEIDSIFAIIFDKGYENLIIDLRYNPGGNIEPALELAAYISDTAYYGGIFLTQRWYNKNAVPPPVESFGNFPVLSEGNMDLLLDGIHNEEGICLKIIPVAETYNGKVYIIVNEITASTCEPLVYGAKQYELATVVGEKTRGEMLNSEFFEIGSGFRLFLPTAEYYTSDGYRIDMKGVEPDLNVRSKKKLAYILDNLIE